MKAARSLLELPDEFFVGAAYRQHLGRSPDPAGFKEYLLHLQRGMSRAKVLRVLESSREAAEHRARAVPAVDGSRDDGWRTEHRLAELAAAFDPGHGSQSTWTGRLHAIFRSSRDGRGDNPTRGSQAADLAAARPTQPHEVRPARPSSARVVFTIASRNYLPYVRTLMHSVRAVHPAFARILLLVDEPEPGDNADGDLYTVVHARSLGIEAFDDMTLRYDVVELNTALKPFFFDWLFAGSAVDTAVYLDPDIRLYAPMTRLLEALDSGASVVLTPHITQPLAAGAGLPDDHQFLRTGVFNLGFVAMRRDPESLGFTRWWAGHLQTDCRVDFQDNLFTDQRWCDLAPCLLARLHVLRDPAYNVAYWNLEHRHLARAGDGRWLVNGEHLVFFHFSGIDPARPDTLSKHQDRLIWDDCPNLDALFAEYRCDLARHGWPQGGAATYTYGAIDGIALQPVLRRFYRRRHPKPLVELSRPDLLRKLLHGCLPAPPPGHPDEHGLSDLMRFVHGTRSDVAVAFDLGTPEGRRLYRQWFYAAGVFEHGLADTLLTWAHRCGTVGTQPGA